MLQNTKAKKKSYALKTMADYHGKLLEVDFNGMLLNFNGKEFWTTLTGKFNVYNLLLVFGIAAELGFEQDEILQAISRLKEFPEDLKHSNPTGGFSYRRLCTHSGCFGKHSGQHQRYQNQERKINHCIWLWRRQRPLQKT